MNTILLLCSFLNCYSFGLYLDAVPKALAPVPGCPQQMNIQWVDGAQVYHFQSGNRCLVYLSPDPKSIVFRSYAFSSEGMFQIFNSFGEGDESVSTGARVFFFFPKGKQIQASWNGKDEIHVETAFDEVVTFASGKLRMLRATRSHFQEDSNISGDNFGGVEVLQTSGWYVDSGFKVGTSPFLDIRRTSRVVSPKGLFCDIPNADLFIYDAKTGDGRLRSETSVIQLFQKFCPQAP